nr:MAG: putative RNA-dependent RNA polymerase [Totiviridae sp.]
MCAQRGALSARSAREGSGLHAHMYTYNRLVQSQSHFQTLRPYYNGVFRELMEGLHFDVFFKLLRGVDLTREVSYKDSRVLGVRGIITTLDVIDMKRNAGVFTKIECVHAVDLLAARTIAYEEKPIQLPISTDLLSDMMYWCGTHAYEEVCRHGVTCGLTRAGTLLIDVDPEFEPNPGLTGAHTPKKEALLHIFPRKAHPLAGRKANLFLDCVLADLLEVMPEVYGKLLRLVGVIQPGLITDDQFCAAVLYAFSASRHVPFFTALGYALLGCMNDSLIKKVSDCLKALGGTRNALGCIMVEVNTLSGRGVNRCDLVADARLRIGRGKQHYRVVNLPERQLREAIRTILREELGDNRPQCPNLDAFWDQRFRWCVGGNHSRAANRHWDKHVDYVPPQGRTLTRRICAEYTADNPLLTWDGSVGVSLAEKIEHGKSRAIYSCDTLSYFAFTWLLRPVEEAWASRRVILDPGKGGRVGIFNRISEAHKRPGSKVFVMADYADFNSQHSLRSQRILMEEVMDCCQGIDPRMRDLLANSFYLMDCYYKGAHLGRINSTMMSGHRGTTFINSILNAAYCYCAWGAHTYNKVTTFHVGDDVIAFVRDEAEGWDLLDKLTELGCELQKSKQSVGREVFEFLRMAGHPAIGARGYLARSVAGLASGNWVTDFTMEPREGLASLINQARSIINRSENAYAYRLMVGSASMITGLARGDLAPMLSGEVALAPGPCYRSDGKYVYRTIENYYERVTDLKDRETIMKQPLNASHDYLNRGLHYVERMAVIDAGYAPLRAMAFASYGRMEPGGRGVPGIGFRKGCLTLSPLLSEIRHGVVRTADVTSTEVKHGLLACYPVAQLLKDDLSDEAIRSMLDALGKKYDERNLHSVAWGAEHTGSTIKGWIPYSDAAGIAARYLTGTVVVDQPIKL